MNLYCTADAIGVLSGGGTVTQNELQALKELGETRVLSAEELNSARYHLPDTPFLCDMLAAAELWDGIHGDIAHFYSGTFSTTIDYLGLFFLTYTCPAHDRKESMQEFKDMGIPYNYPHIADDRLWEIFTRGLKRVNVVIAPSKLSADFLRQEGCQSITIIPHGCNLPERIPAYPEDFHIGYMGQLGPDKGVCYLLQAWGKLNYRDSSAVFAAHPDWLTSLINRYAGAGNFKCMGHVSKLEDFYSQVSVYVMPSVCEAFSITVLEAMAYGRPVIVSDGAGVAGLITDGVEGFVVKKRDPGAIAERIDWFKHNREKIPVMGAAARATAEKHTWDKIRQRYKALWVSKGQADA